MQNFERVESASFLNPSRYQEIFEKHKKYLETYKAMSGGSTQGAVSFKAFYHFTVYISKYSDKQIFLRAGYS